LQYAQAITVCVLQLQLQYLKIIIYYKFTDSFQSPIFSYVGPYISPYTFRTGFFLPRIAPGRNQPDPARIPAISYKLQAIRPRM